MIPEKLIHEVRRYLEQKYNQTTQALPMYADNDIDFWTSETYTYSVKEAKKGELWFELECCDRQTKQWVPSWFHTGRPRFYVFVDGGRYLVLNRQRLLSYLEKNGWTSVIKVKRDSKDVSEARYGVMSIRHAFKNGLVERL